MTILAVAAVFLSQGPVPVEMCEASEPGTRIIFGGRVLDTSGRPISKAAVSAYNTDMQGLYNPRNANTRVSRIRGAAVTDSQGRFLFKTNRPGSYPGTDEPAHIHIEAIAPGHTHRYVTFWFDDDPLVTPARRRQASGDAETRIVKLQRVDATTTKFTFDVQLSGN